MAHDLTETASLLPQKDPSHPFPGATTVGSLSSDVTHVCCRTSQKGKHSLCAFCVCLLFLSVVSLRLTYLVCISSLFHFVSVFCCILFTTTCSSICLLVTTGSIIHKSCYESLTQPWCGPAIVFTLSKHRRVEFLGHKEGMRNLGRNDQNSFQWGLQESE